MLTTNTIKYLFLVTVFFSLLFFSSCKNDDELSPASRTIKYEVEGNFSGSLFASYTTGSGGTANEQISVPWSKEITYASNVTAAVIAISGNGGLAGQQITIVVKRDGNQVSSTLATAGSSGSFPPQAAPVITF